MSFRDVDLATIEVMSAALVRGGSSTHTIGAGADGVLMGLVNHGVSGPAATAMIRRWELQKPAQEATSSAMTAAGQALGDYAVGISSLQRQFAAVMSQAAAVDLQCQADGVTCLPYGYDPLTDTRALPQAMAAATSALAALDEAAAGLDSTLVGGLRAACGQLEAAGVTRVPTEQERLNEESGAYKGYLPARDDQQLSLAHGLLTAPAVAVALAERDAQEAAGEASQLGKDMHSTDPAVRSAAAGKLRGAGKAALLAGQDAEELAVQTGRMGRGVYRGLGKTVGVGGRFLEDIPVVGIGFAMYGTWYDHEQGASWQKAATSNASALVVGTVVTVMILAAPIGGGVLLVAGAAVVGGIVAVGVGQFVNKLRDEHGNVVQALGDVGQAADHLGDDIGHATGAVGHGASKMWHSVFG